MLLVAGADPCSVGEDGANAFHMAALISNAATLRELLPFVPDINLPDHDGNTALHHAANDEWAALGEIAELVRMGANVEARNNNGQTALHIAADAQRSETADELVECGASVNAVDKNGRTPLNILVDSYAAYFDSMVGKYEIGESLTSHRAPRAKIPSAVQDIWVNTVLAGLHNAELEQALS